MSDHLSLPIRLPDEDTDRFERLATLTQHVATHILEDHRTPAHLDGIADSSHQAWKYFDEHEPFKTPDMLTPETRGDWSWMDYERDGYDAFHDLLAHGDLSAPEFQPSRRKNGVLTTNSPSPSKSNTQRRLTAPTVYWRLTPECGKT